MAYDRYPPQWSKERVTTQIAGSKISRRPRLLLVVLAALFGIYSLVSFITGSSIPLRYSPRENASSFRTQSLAQSASDNRQEYNAKIDAQTATLGEVREQLVTEPFAGARIGKISMMYGDRNPAYERALQSHIEHGQRHHYPMFILRQKLLGRLWTKPAYIMSVILNELQKPEGEDRLEWLFWFDADTYLINPKIPLEIFLPPTPDFDHIYFLCSNDHNGLNDGAFLMRVNEWTLHMMAAAISVETFRPDVSLKYSEQSAIEHLVKNEPMYINHSAIIPQRWYNAYMGPREWDGRIKPHKQIMGNSVLEGDILVHFSGSGNTKSARMTRFMSAYEKNSASWQLELSETEYLGEIKEFWEQWTRVEIEGSEKSLPQPENTEPAQPGAGDEPGTPTDVEAEAEQSAEKEAR